jgi:hypothetical protein
MHTKIQPECSWKPIERLATHRRRRALTCAHYARKLTGGRGQELPRNGAGAADGSDVVRLRQIAVDSSVGIERLEPDMLKTFS